MRYSVVLWAVAKKVVHQLERKRDRERERVASIELFTELHSLNRGNRYRRIDVIVSRSYCLFRGNILPLFASAERCTCAIVPSIFPFRFCTRVSSSNSLREDSANWNKYKFVEFQGNLLVKICSNLLNDLHSSLESSWKICFLVKFIVVSKTKVLILVLWFCFFFFFSNRFI